MEEVIFTLMSLKENLSFKVSSENPIDNFVFSFLALFPGVDFEERKINALQFNTSDLRTNIQYFVDQHAAQLPMLNQVTAFFRKMDDNEAFYFLPDIVLDQGQFLRLSNYLISLKENANFDEIQGQMDDLFSDLLKNYTFASYGDKNIQIGERTRANRVCRFCDNKRENLSFKNRAHAISEALGNKTVILLDECDGCNEHFSKLIEPSIIEWFSFYRTVYKIPGKGGTKKFKGQNFKIEHTDTIHIEYHADDDKIDDLPVNYVLKSNQDISKQNIYKAFCKFFLSVIPSSELPAFKETIEWINGNRQIETLPLIATMLFGKMAEQPTLVTYIRRNSNTDIPFAVGEFHYALFKYVFIVPLCNKDTKEFITETEYKKFWEMFKHYNMNKGWRFDDFSNAVSKPFAINLRFEKRDKNESSLENGPI